MTQLHHLRSRRGGPRRIWSRAAAIAITMGLIAGCSAASSSPAGTTSDGLGQTTAAAGSSAPSLNPAAGSPSSEHSRYCNAIKLPDAQVLLKDTITQDNFDPLEETPPFDCMITTSRGDVLTVSIATTDTFASWVADENAGTGTALTGAGDKAVWVQDPTKANPPIVVAIKGSVTCRVTAAETAKTTIEFTDPNGIDQIGATAAASFAQKMAVLCTDVFVGPS